MIYTKAPARLQVHSSGFDTTTHRRRAVCPNTLFLNHHLWQPHSPKASLVAAFQRQLGECCVGGLLLARNFFPEGSAALLLPKSLAHFVQAP